MRIHNCLRLTNLRSGKASMVDFAVSVRNMHMDARLFTRKEEEAKLTVAHNGWCRTGTLTNFLSNRPD